MYLKIFLFATIGIAAAVPMAHSADSGTKVMKNDCSLPEYRQFDFWVGEWRAVNTKTGAPEGESKIENLYDGCGIRENWQDPELKGGSLNIYDRTDKKWHQFWIDSSGARREFIGGLEDGKMILTATHPSMLHPEKTVSERMTFTPNPDGSVRQYSEATIDGGKVWTERYDYTYRRK
ncbi:MAG: hypothetical protein ABJB01_02770 [Rudaea sp.]